MISLDYSHFPELDTERLHLRALAHSDLEAMFRLRTNEIVCLHIPHFKDETREDTEKYIAKIIGFMRENKSLYWVICLKGSDFPIGTVLLWNFVSEPDQAELGYVLDPAYHGKGFMQEALEKVLSYASDSLKLQAVEAWTQQDNLASKRLLVKNKFVFDASRRSEHSDTDVYYTLKF